MSKVEHKKSFGMMFPESFTHGREVFDTLYDMKGGAIRTNVAQMS